MSHQLKVMCKKGHVGGKEGDVKHPCSEFELAHVVIYAGFVPQDNTKRRDRAGRTWTCHKQGTTSGPRPPLARSGRRHGRRTMKAWGRGGNLSEVRGAECKSVHQL